MFLLLVQLAGQADKAIKAAVAHYKEHPKATPADLAGVVQRETRAWAPAHKGKAVLTSHLRVTLADALGGLAYNLAAADAGKDPV